MEPEIGRPGVVRKLRNLMRGLSRFRDLQVQQAMLAPLISDHPLLEARLDVLKKGESLAASLVAGQLSSFPVEKLAAAVAEARIRLRRKSAGARARQRLGGPMERSHHRLQTLRSGIDPSDPATIHRLRVAFKKYRYLVEPLAPLSGNPDPSVLSRMHDLQGAMGDIQDLAVMMRDLRSWAASSERRRETGQALRLLSVKLEQKTASFLSLARNLDSFVFPLRKDG